MPITEEKVKEPVIKKDKKEKKPTMSFWTAFKLSLKNLFTKKGRTILTSFAGSIGIIGIALILAVSQGMTRYIDQIQESTLSSYPITLESTTIDLTSLMESMMGTGTSDFEHDTNHIYKDPLIGELVNALASIEANENDLKSFKKYLESQLKVEGSKFNTAISGIQYTYNMNLAIYTKNVDGNIIKSDVNELMQEMIRDYMILVSNNGTQSGNNNTNQEAPSSPMSFMMGASSLWKEMLPGLGEKEIINNIIYEQYDLIDGSWPNEYDEVVLIVNEKNEIDDLTLFALGLLSQEEIDEIIEKAANGQTIDNTLKKWSYSELTGRTYKTILPHEYYKDFDNDGIFTDMSKIDNILETLYESALELKISGIIRPKKDAENVMLSGGIGYTSLLTTEIIKRAQASDVVKAQLDNKSINVLTGKPFQSSTGILSNEEKKESFINYVNNMNDVQKGNTYIAIKSLLTEEELLLKTQQEMAQYPTRDLQETLIATSMAGQLELDAETLKQYLKELSDEQVLGYVYAICEQIAIMKHQAMIKMQYSKVPANELAALLNEQLTSATIDDYVIYYDNVTDFSDLTYEEVLIQLGCVDEESPATINIYTSTFENKDLIADGIKEYNKNVDENKQIEYTDYMALLMSGITTIINAITYVLIAFVAISLVVSSIMIGVITLISVQERTKEIGILRAIGASKKDVSSMFNAETLIIGFASGLLGVLVTYVLCIPINLILHALTDVQNLNAILPIGGALILIIISMSLTLIAGLIPSRSAAKKDPVIALRTE